MENEKRLCKDCKHMKMVGWFFKIPHCFVEIDLVTGERLGTFSCRSERRNYLGNCCGLEGRLYEARIKPALTESECHPGFEIQDEEKICSGRWTCNYILFDPKTRLCQACLSGEEKIYTHGKPKENLYQGSICEDHLVEEAVHHWKPVRGFLDTQEKVARLRKDLHLACREKFKEYENARNGIKHKHPVKKPNVKPVATKASPRRKRNDDPDL